MPKFGSEPRPLLREVGKRDADKKLIDELAEAWVEESRIGDADISWVLIQLRLRTQVLEDIERVMADPHLPAESKVDATIAHIRQVLDHGLGDEPPDEPEF